MEDVHVLMTDISIGLPYTLLESLVEKKAVPFVLVKDFENVQGISEDFPSAIPIILNTFQSFESTKDYIDSLPPMGCIFNFDGEKFETLYRQTFDHFMSITVCKDDFEITQIYEDILESVSEEYTLIINIVSFSLSSALALQGNLQLTSVDNVTVLDSPPNLKVVFEKLFARSPHKPRLTSSKPKKTHQQQQAAALRREMNPISAILRKIFTRFNPCCTSPALNFFPVNSNVNIIKTPEEIREYIRIQQCHEIKISLRQIHETVLRNWSDMCEKSFTFTPELVQQFRRMCQDIERKGEEGRETLLEKVNKDIRVTEQWGHVLGTRAVDRLKISREKEINSRVQQFCARKVTEARQQIEEEIKQHKIRTKGRLYREILDEQIMELVRIKEKYNKRLELLMLPYTGEFNVLQN